MTTGSIVKDIISKVSVWLMGGGFIGLSILGLALFISDIKNLWPIIPCIAGIILFYVGIMYIMSNESAANKIAAVLFTLAKCFVIAFSLSFIACLAIVSVGEFFRGHYVDASTSACLAVILSGAFGWVSVNPK